MSSKIEHLGVNSVVRYKVSFISFQRIILACRYHCMTALAHSQKGPFSAVDRSSRRRPLPAVLPDPLPATDWEQHCGKSHCSPLPHAPLRSGPHHDGAGRLRPAAAARCHQADRPHGDRHLGLPPRRPRRLQMRPDPPDRARTRAAHPGQPVRSCSANRTSCRPRSRTPGNWPTGSPASVTFWNPRRAADPRNKPRPPRPDRHSCQNNSKYSRCSQSVTAARKRSISAVLRSMT